METIVLNIDGHEVSAREGTTILAAALDAGIYIPNLCHQALCAFSHRDAEHVQQEVNV